MCGRFVTSSPPDELARYFGAVPPEEPTHEPNFNVAPTTDVYVVYEDGSTRRLESFHWGLIPSWAKDEKIGNRMINARAEGVASSRVFKRPFVRRRCIIPADGFYEWSKVAGHRRKQPYYVHRADDEPLAFAGLWEAWRPREHAGDAADEPRAHGGEADGGEEAPLVRSCTIITTDANETIEPLHDRMPVILPPHAWAAWLDPDNHDTDSLARLLVPAPAELVTFHPVSTDVNNPRNRGSHLVEEVDVVDPDGAQAPSGQQQLAPPDE